MAEDRRRDHDLRQMVDACLNDNAQLREELEQSKRDRAALRKRGRNLKRSTAGLAAWLSAVMLVGFVEVLHLVNQVRDNRQEIILQNCRGHDAFVNGYSAGIDSILSNPVELRRRAQRDGLLVADEAARLRAARAATIRLVDALQPRNPKRRGDTRPCTVIARELR